MFIPKIYSDDRGGQDWSPLTPPSSPPLPVTVSTLSHLHVQDTARHAAPAVRHASRGRPLAEPYRTHRRACRAALHSQPCPRGAGALPAMHATTSRVPVRGAPTCTGGYEHARANLAAPGRGQENRGHGAARRAMPRQLHRRARHVLRAGAAGDPGSPHIYPSIHPSTYLSPPLPLSPSLSFSR